MKKHISFLLALIILLALTGCFENKSKYMIIDLSTGDINYTDSEPVGGWSDVYKITKLVLRRVEPGSFIMGSPESEMGRNPNETQHEVAITKPFYIGVFEITRGQYQLITGKEPAFRSYQGKTFPLDELTYNDIRGVNKGAKWPISYAVDDDSFIGILRKKYKLNFDLPTEAQWEYACRAGTTTALNNGTNLSDEYKDQNLDKVGAYCFNRNSSTNFDHYVGFYRPNSWGLYDMHGNDLEWCLDWHSISLGYNSAIDPLGPSSGERRVLRGGGWSMKAADCRSASRFSCPPNGITSRGFKMNVGIRIVLTQ